MLFKIRALIIWIPTYFCAIAALYTKAFIVIICNKRKKRDTFLGKQVHTKHILILILIDMLLRNISDVYLLCIVGLK